MCQAIIVSVVAGLPLGIVRWEVEGQEEMEEQAVAAEQAGVAPTACQIVIVKGRCRVISRVAGQVHVPVEQAVDQGRVQVAMAAGEVVVPALRIVTVNQIFPVMRQMAGERVRVLQVRDLAPVAGERVQSAALIVIAKDRSPAIALEEEPVPVGQGADQGRVATEQAERELSVLLTVIAWQIWRVM